MTYSRRSLINTDYCMVTSTVQQLTKLVGSVAPSGPIHIVSHYTHIQYPSPPTSAVSCQRNRQCSRSQGSSLARIVKQASIATEIEKKKVAGKEPPEAEERNKNVSLFVTISITMTRNCTNNPDYCTEE